MSRNVTAASFWDILPSSTESVSLPILFSTIASSSDTSCTKLVIPNAVAF